MKNEKKFIKIEIEKYKKLHKNIRCELKWIEVEIKVVRIPRTGEDD